MNRALHKPLLVCAAVLALQPWLARAFDADDVKDATENACNWLIEKYDTSQKVFGKGEGATDPARVARILLALSESPNDYKEANGPFISEPARNLARFVQKTTEPVSYDICDALKSLNGKKYDALLQQCATKSAPSASAEVKNLEQLTSITSQYSSLDSSRMLAEALLKQNKKEISVGGKTVVWPEVLAQAVIKLQKEDGSFSEDIEANAAALRILDACYKAMTN